MPPPVPIIIKTERKSERTVKKLVIILLACLLLVTAAACGAPAEETAKPAAPYNPAVEEAVGEEMPAESEVEEPAEEPEEVPAEPVEPTEPEEPAETPVEEVTEGPVEVEAAVPNVEDLLAFVDQPLSDLIEVIGEPVEEYYEYSCSGPGDDGLLTYDGFIVFTYREPDGTTEVVVDVEAE